MHQQRNYFFIFAALSLLVGGCAGPAAFRTDDVPDALRTSGNQRLTLQAHATGVQIYQCKPAKDDGTRFE